MPPAGAARHLLGQRLHLFRRRHAAAAKAHRLRDAGHRAALARAHRLHHVGHVPVHLEQLVDLLDLQAGAGGDALLAAGLEDVGILALLPRHRIDDRDLALEHLVVDARRRRSGSSSWRRRASCPSARRCRPCSPSAASCSRMSARSNWPLRIRSAVRAAFSASIFAAAFSTSETTSPMPRMRPAMRRGMEIFQRVGLFAGADQLDRLAGDRAHRQRRAAAAVAVDARQHDAGEADALVERRARD